MSAANRPQVVLTDLPFTDVPEIAEPPWVVFACVSHFESIALTTSRAMFAAMANLHSTVKIWRQNRLLSPSIRDEIERRGTTIRQTFGAALQNLKARKGLDRRDSLNVEQCTDDNLAFLENETRSALLV